MESVNKDGSPRKRRKWLRVVLTFGLLLTLAIAAAPWILAGSGLRDQLFAALVNDPTVSVSSRKASLGYFSPLSITGLQIHSDDGRTKIEFESIEAEKSWLAMLLNKSDLGSFKFAKPAFDLTINEASQSSPGAGREAASENLPLPTLTAVIDGASVKIRQAGQSHPAVDLQGVDITLHLQRDDVGSLFVIEPITVFDHTVLTPELCDQGIQLVAPLLASEVDADGEFSLRLSTFKVPVGTSSEREKDPRRMEVAGELQLHRASVGLKNSVTQRLAGLAAELLGTDVPKRLTVAEDCEVAFHVIDGRVHHRGLALVLPHSASSVGLDSSGSVGLDGSLDIEVAMRVPPNSLGESDLARHLVEQPVVLQVGGTIEDPRITLAENHAWTEELQFLLTSNDLGGAVELVDRVTDLLGALFEQSPEREERLFPAIRDRLRERREGRKK